MSIKPGEKAQANDVLNAFGKICKNQSNILFNNEYNGWNSSLDKQDNNVFYDVFTSDSAFSTSAMTYQTASDSYEADIEETNSFLIMSDSTTASVVDAIPIINGRFWKSYSNNITNNSFESGFTGWTTAGDSQWTMETTSTNSSVGSTAILISNTTDAVATASISQTMDLSNVDTIGFYQAKNVDFPATVQYGLYINSTLVIEHNYFSNPLTFVYRPIPSAQRVDNAVVEIRASRGTGLIQGFNLYLDYFDIWNSSESVLQTQVSADGGSNWSNATDSQVVRPTSGTELLRKYSMTNTDGSLNPEYNYITEEAIYYNLG